MREEEAKTKWCPKSMASMLEECTMGVTAYVYNRMSPFDSTEGIIPEECRCIASNCAIWAWDNVLDNPESATNGMITPIWSKSDTSGYCGLIK